MLQINSTYLKVINRWMEHEGVFDRELFKAISRLSPGQPVALNEASDLVCRAAALSDKPAPCLGMASLVTWRDLGALGHMLQGALTLEELIGRYISFERLFYGVSLASVIRRPGHLDFFWDVRPAVPRRELFQLTIGTWQVMLKSMFPSDQLIGLVTFPQSEALDRQACEVFFGCPVLFDVSTTGVRLLGERLLDRPFFPDGGKRGNRLALQAERLDEDEIVAELVELIQGLLAERRATISVVAEKLGMSTRTLQRRLEYVPGGFRGVLDKAREEMAYEYLMDSGLSLGDVAHLLGYSEQSAFNLAFRRWSGLSPRVWQRKQK